MISLFELPSEILLIVIKANFYFVDTYGVLIEEKLKSPKGSSRTTPAQSPGANCVSPMKAMCPGLAPPTHTLSPIMKLSVSSVRTTLVSVQKTILLS